MRWLLLVALSTTVACAAEDPNDEWLWGLDIPRTTLGIGEQTFAFSGDLGPYPGEPPTPIQATWSIEPGGVVQLSSPIIGSSIGLTGVAAGTAVLTAENASGETRSRTITVTVP